MKNEQTNNQTGKQDDKNQQQNVNKPGTSSTGKTDGSPAQKSNISVDNEGRIGKAHDQWNNGNQNKQDQRENDQNPNNNRNQTRSDKTVTEPEIDAPIYDPEKTEKKIPQMENKNKK